MPNYGNDTPIVLSNFATKETGRVMGKIMQSLATRSIWTNVIKGGTFPAGMGDSLRTVVQLPSITADLNYAKPDLIDFTAICGNLGLQAKHSTTEYVTKLQSLRGRGPDICVNQGYGAFKGWLEMAIDALVKDTRLIRDAIDRSQIYAMSGTRYSAVAAAGFSARFAGGTELSLGVTPIATLPDSPISFTGLRNIVSFVKEDLFAEPYNMKVQETGGYDHFALFIGSQEIIDSFRRETAVQTALNALTTGGFKFGEKALTSMNFQTAGAWQGIAMQADQFPLRYNAVGTGTGQGGNGTAVGVPVFISPFVEVVDDQNGNRSHRAPNPAYRSATYEVGFLLFENAVERLVPERYTGEGSAKFDPRLGNGELKWHYAIDNTSNQWGDFGFHKYEFTQAYRPLRPQHLVTLHYKRCPLVDLTAC